MIEGDLVEVALPVPLATFFTYRLGQGQSAFPGVRVRVSFGPRKLVGVIFGRAQEHAATPHKIKDIQEILDPEPLLGRHELTLARWVADYWFAPPGEAVGLLLPPRMAEGAEAPSPKTTLSVRLVSAAAETPKLSPKMSAVLEWLARQGSASVDTLRAATGASLDTLRRLEAKGHVALENEQRFRDPLSGRALAGLKTGSGAAHPLTAAQTAAVEAVRASFGRYQGFLLHGVTGSGKTEVYLALIEDALARGEGAIVLVPEIALTPQLVARFRVRLGDRVAVQHSALDPVARHEQWLRVRSGELPVVVGARSALFSPLPKLGLIVVDEEHEPSFKQESSPRYHARDLALVRGHLEGAPVVLGSATPSLESWTNVARQKLTRLALPERAHQKRPLPEVSLVDLRDTPTADPDKLFSVPLRDALVETLARGEQSLLFLNRRGYSNLIQCGTCGEPIECHACSVTCTWHKKKRRLICHYCDESRPFPETCPKCGAADLAELGHGTEQIEDKLEHLLPHARIGRMDRDTTRGKALLNLLTDFRKGELDILIGTQMLAKGHDFPGVTLVGVLNAEQSLAFPDFRAAERTFGLLTQIAGRAGRAERPGRVIIQTRMPDHYAIARAVSHDVTGFLDLEGQLREARLFPPFSHLALFRVSGRDGMKTEGFARDLARHLREASLTTGDRAVCNPVQPAPIERVKEMWRFQILVRGTDRKALRRVLEMTREHWSGRLPSGLQIGLDIDPMSFL